MELINILESDLRMGYGNSYIKYREIIKTLLKDFNNEDINNYNIEETEESMIKNLKIYTINDTIKDLKFTQTYNTSENTYENAIIEAKYKKLTINYQPFSITSLSRIENDYSRFVFIKEMSNNKTGVKISIDNSHRDDDDKIEANVAYMTESTNTNGIISSINEATNYIDKIVKTKTLS